MSNSQAPVCDFRSTRGCARVQNCLFNRISATSCNEATVKIQRYSAHPLNDLGCGSDIQPNGSRYTRCSPAPKSTFTCGDRRKGWLFSCDAKCRSWPRLCKKGLVSAPCAEHRRLSRAERQFLLESILRAPGTLPGASAGIDFDTPHPSAQVARASSSPATPMIAITRLML